MKDKLKSSKDDPVDKTKCPRCQSDKIVHFSSLNYRLCHTCNHTYDWLVEKGQKKII